MNLKKVLLLSAITFNFLLLSSVNEATANPSDANTSNELVEMFACRQEINPEKRLACYDKTVGQFENAQSEGEILTISKEEIENVKKDSFGFSIPSLPKLNGLFSDSKRAQANDQNDLTAPVGQAKSAEIKKEVIKVNPKREEIAQIKEVSIPIVKTQSFGYKKTRLFLENGQVWQTKETVKLRIPKIRKDNLPIAVIRKGALGSFLLQINGSGRAVLVTRVR